MLRSSCFHEVSDWHVCIISSLFLKSCCHSSCSCTSHRKFHATDSFYSIFFYIFHPLLRLSNLVVYHSSSLASEHLYQRHWRCACSVVSSFATEDMRCITITVKYNVLRLPHLKGTLPCPHTHGGEEHFQSPAQSCDASYRGFLGRHR